MSSSHGNATFEPTTINNGHASGAESGARVGASTRPAEIIDFTTERGRHKDLYGREDVFA